MSAGRRTKKNLSDKRKGFFAVVIEAVEPVDNCEIVSSGAGNVVHRRLWMENRLSTHENTPLIIHRLIPVDSTEKLGINKCINIQPVYSGYAYMQRRITQSPRMLLCSFLMTSSVWRDFLRSSSILLQACMTVVWSRLKIFAMSGKEYSSSWRIIYIAIWRG